jgi:hypothetical protein
LQVSFTELAHGITHGLTLVQHEKTAAKKKSNFGKGGTGSPFLMTLPLAVTPPHQPSTPDLAPLAGSAFSCASVSPSCATSSLPWA